MAGGGGLCHGAPRTCAPGVQPQSQSPRIFPAAPLTVGARLSDAPSPGFGPFFLSDASRALRFPGGPSEEIITEMLIKLVFLRF